MPDYDYNYFYLLDKYYRYFPSINYNTKSLLTFTKPKTKYLNFTYRFKKEYKHIVNDFFTLLELGSLNKRKLQRRFKQDCEKTLDYLLANLIQITKLNIYQTVFISFRPNTFSDSHCNYRQFIKIINAMISHNLIEREKGRKRTNFFDKNVWIYETASTLRLNKKFLSFCEKLNINYSNIENILEKSLPKYFIKCRKPSKLIRGKKYKGELVSVNTLKSNPLFKEINSKLNEFNNFLNNTSFTNMKFNGLVRMYASHIKGAEFSFGGRLQALGNENYQSLSKIERSKILINNNSVKEIDIKACHLSIFCSCINSKLPSNDPYNIKGVHKDIVKAWVNISLTNSSYCKRWPTKTRRKLIKLGHNMKKFTANKVLEIILPQIPVLKFLEGKEISWKVLQYSESELIFRTIYQLYKRNIVALPVHDSLIVEMSNYDESKKLLSETFYKMFGIKPILN